MLLIANDTAETTAAATATPAITTATTAAAATTTTATAAKATVTTAAAAATAQLAAVSAAAVSPTTADHKQSLPRRARGPHTITTSNGGPVAKSFISRRY